MPLDRSVDPSPLHGELAGAGVHVVELPSDSMIHGFADMASSPAADEATGRTLAASRTLLHTRTEETPA